MFTEQGFIPIRNSETFHTIINQKNQTLKDLRDNLESQKNPYFHPSKDLQAILKDVHLSPRVRFALNFEQGSQTSGPRAFYETSDIFNKRKASTDRNAMHSYRGSQEVIGINGKIKELEKAIEKQEAEILEFKRKEIRRLVKDYNNPNSSMRKLDVNFK